MIKSEIGIARIDVFVFGLSMRMPPLVCVTARCIWSNFFSKSKSPHCNPNNSDRRKPVCISKTISYLPCFMAYCSAIFACSAVYTCRSCLGLDVIFMFFTGFLKQRSLSIAAWKIALKIILCLSNTDADKAAPVSAFCTVLKYRCTSICRIICNRIAPKNGIKYFSTLT